MFLVSYHNEIGGMTMYIYCCEEDDCKMYTRLNVVFRVVSLGLKKIKGSP